MVATNLPFDEWADIFASELLTGALLDRLRHSRENTASQATYDPDEE